MGADEKIKVLVVDDSAPVRHLLTEVINGAGDMRVVGGAADPMAAHQMIKILEPDVLTLDLEMPKMNGLEFLRRLMQFRPMPVVMVSMFMERGSGEAAQALQAGAVDCVAKPHGQIAPAEFAWELREKIRNAHGARERIGRMPLPALPRQAPAAPPREAAVPGGWRPAPEDLIVIGASTGGTEALKDVLVTLPESSPGILIVQHMPQSFTGSFAKRLDSLCRIRVKEAEDGEPVVPGTAYVAPGHSHLLVRKSGAGGYATELSSAEPVNRHRPSVDVLFHSAAACAGRHAVAAILTGMGKDGAAGMLALKRAGAYTIAQSAETCVVYGMPREAVALGAVDEIAPLSEVGCRLMGRLAGPRLRLPQD